MTGGALRRTPIAPRAAAAAAAACKIFQEEGRLVTVREFGHLMGGGSLRDAAAAHRSWRAQLLEEARRPTPPAPAPQGDGQPDQALQARIDALQAQLALESERYDGLRRALLMETSRQRDEYAQRAEVLAHERARLEEELVMLRARLRGARAEASR